MPLAYSDIDRFAQKIRNLLSIPEEKTLKKNDLENIITQLKGNIEYDNSLLFEALLFPLTEHERKFIIKIKSPSNTSKRSDNRINFILAHELAHLFLHTDFPKTDWNRDWESFNYHKNGYYGQIENESDSFASCFLMPKMIFTEIVKKYTISGKCMIDKVAKHFSLQEKRILNRGYDLGLFHD